MKTVVTKPVLVISVADDGVARALIHDGNRRKVKDTDQLVGVILRALDLLRCDYPFAAGHIGHVYNLEIEDDGGAQRRA